MAKIFHPDAPQGNEDVFLELQQAFETLSDPVKRREYNEKSRLAEARILPTVADEAHFVEKMKIEDEKKNFSLHTEFPGVSENNQVAVGMVDPQFNMTIYPKLAVFQAVFFTGLGVSIKKYGFLSSSLIIWKKALDGRLLFGPGATLWSETPIIPGKF